VPSFQKVSGARLMGARLSAEGNLSESFRTFLAGLERVRSRLAGEPPQGGGTT